MRMTCRKPGHLRGAIVLAVITVVTTAAADPAIKSTWTSHPLKIDGRLDEWPALTTIENGPAIAAANDASSLYLAVSATDPRVRDALAHGLVLWIDPTGKKKSDFGVQLPGLMIGVGGSALEPAALEDVDILGPGMARRLVSMTSALDMAAATGLSDGVLVFELKLPLAPSAAHTFAVGAPPGRSIEVGLFTPETPQSERHGDSEPPPNPSTYGLGPLIGGPSSGVPLPDGSHKTKVERPMTLKTWVTLALASAP
jgi:hypothetical protein